MSSRNSRFALALHVLTSLAIKQGRDSAWVSSGFLANGVNTHPVVIRRLLCLLERAGMVISKKGKLGGFQLAPHARRLKLSEIYRAIEEAESSVLKIHSNPENKACPVSCQIKGVLSDVFGKADRGFMAELNKIRLADLERRIQT